MSVVVEANEQGQLAATFGFSPDTSGVVEKYGLYVVWGDVDAGSVFSAWGHRQKLTDVTPEMVSHSAVIPSEALMATKMRFFLAEPTYVQRTDGISFVEWNTGKLEYYSRGGLHGLGNDVEVERCEGGTFKFKSPEEIQSLIDCFSVSTGNSQKNTSDLFK
jgi:hypothetical protein